MEAFTTQLPDAWGRVLRSVHLFPDCSTLARRERLYRAPAVWPHSIVRLLVHHHHYEGRLLGSYYDAVLLWRQD